MQTVIMRKYFLPVILNVNHKQIMTGLPYLRVPCAILHFVVLVVCCNETRVDVDVAVACTHDFMILKVKSASVCTCAHTYIQFPHLHIVTGKPVYHKQLTIFTCVHTIVLVATYISW